MTDMLCANCDYDIFNDKNELNYYLASFHKRYDRSLYYKYTINNIDLNNINKIFDYYITIQNEKFDMYLINSVIQVQFNDNITANLENSNQYNTDYINIENYLTMFFTSCENAGYEVTNINHTTINISGCICNIRYKPMSLLERKINYIITKNPQLINQNLNRPLIKFNNIQMNITEITDDILSLCNCTNDNNDNILEISPVFLIISIIPCALSFLCLISFMVYTLIKPLINKIRIHTSI